MTDREIIVDLLKRADIPFSEQEAHEDSEGRMVGAGIIIENSVVERHWAAGYVREQPLEAWVDMKVVFRFSADGALSHAYSTE
jgi:hypothetical protein